jgi:acetyl esterase/lipase
MMVIHRDLEYARAGSRSLLLDLYLPERATGRLPLIVWVHGGAFRMGSKEDCPASYSMRRCSRPAWKRRFIPSRARGMALPAPR